MAKTSPPKVAHDDSDEFDNPDFETSRENAVKAVEVLMDYYQPAPTIASADAFLTTPEIREFVLAIYSDLYFYDNDLLLQLQRAGYRFDMVSPGNLRWLLADRAVLSDGNCPE